MKKIGFIGLGNMGLPMALNLKKKGFEVVGVDSIPAVSEEAQRQGLTVTPRNDDLLASDAIITMLPSGKHSKSVLSGDDGLIGKVGQGCVLIDCSTIEPATAKEIAGEAAAKGIGFLDAPVSGGVRGAAEATLAFIVGGGEATLEKAEPLFSAMGKRAFHAGASGAGQTAKLCNNLLIAIQMIGASEAMSLGIENNLDPATLREIINSSTGACWAAGDVNPAPGATPGAPSSNGYKGGFKSGLMLKDLRLALELAEQSGIGAKLGRLAESIYSSHVGKGNGDLDFSSVFLSLEKQS